MQKGGEEGVQIACKIAYVPNGTALGGYTQNEPLPRTHLFSGGIYA